MPTEIIGEVGTPGASREWISAQATLAIRHLLKIYGPPLAEMELEVQWQEHDLPDSCEDSYDAPIYPERHCGVRPLLHNRQS